MIGTCNILQHILFLCLHRSYFQLLSSATLLARGFSGVIRAFKWKRVALITQNELVFVKASFKFSKCLHCDKISQYVHILV